MQILVTAGGTREPIDGVRYISNFSTGSTGAFIADYLKKTGFNITLLTSIDGKMPNEDLKVIKYTTYRDIRDILKKELGNHSYDAVIQLAAISDYSVDYLESNGKRIEAESNSKLDSSNEFKIVLKSNPKIINDLKSFSRNDITVIGFKLTKNGSEKLIKDKVTSIFSRGEVDFIVHNDLTSITKDSHRTTLYNKSGPLLKGETKSDLGENLKKILLREI